MSVEQPVRVFLVDDHAVVRDGVRRTLESAGGFEVVGEAGDVNDGLDGIVATEPDVAVVDVRIPGGDGVEMVREARSRDLRTRFLVFTSFREADAYYHAVMAGATGFLVKDVARKRLVETVRKVAGGEKVVDLREIEALPAPPGTAELLMVDLTDRERAILELIAAGLTNREIASELFLAEKTVRNYVSSVLAKLGMRNRTEVAAYVVRLVTRQQSARRLAS